MHDLMYSFKATISLPSTPKPSISLSPDYTARPTSSAKPITLSGRQLLKTNQLKKVEKENEEAEITFTKQ
jgi:hypothetical protein